MRAHAEVLKPLYLQAKPRAQCLFQPERCFFPCVLSIVADCKHLLQDTSQKLAEGLFETAAFYAKHEAYLSLVGMS